MSKPKNAQKSEGLTRRGFLGRVSLGLVGIASLAIPLRSLLSPAKGAKGPADGLPEDSIFQPRRDPRTDNERHGTA
ncbi:MAG: hypothetical protein ACE1ZD_03740 [Dehalococcoidia bacterium]